MKRVSNLIAALAVSALFSPAAVSQQPNSQGMNPPKAATSTTTPSNTGAGVGGSGAFSGWLSDYQGKNQGKISRQAYMDEVGRRWDAADGTKQGLTMDQINQTYGMGSGPAGTSTAPGNMGPNNVKK